MVTVAFTAQNQNELLEFLGKVFENKKKTEDVLGALRRDREKLADVIDELVCKVSDDELC